ncbi:MAG: MerR family transcriptional regulator, partial [Candidatus Omnitrophica bacterium]|nr:MerR family transcriptional regulator [Candidatus Omnitrophota bacterium]
EIDINIDEDEPLFPIEIVCKMAHLQYWKLRSFLKEGIVKPRKVGRKKMLFSLEDIKKIEFVNILMKKEGINIKGVKFIMEIEGF